MTLDFFYSITIVSESCRRVIVDLPATYIWGESCKDTLRGIGVTLAETAETPQAYSHMTIYSVIPSEAAQRAA